MKIITEQIENAAGFYDLADELRSGVLFDIETTGFKAEYNPIYLIGCAHMEKGGCVLTQFFAEERSDERELLDAFISYLCERSEAAQKKVPLITFNGDRFDIPFVDRRIAKYGGTYSLSEHPKHDLYLFAKKNKSLFGLESMKQKSLEEFIGIYRDDRYNGGELIDVYGEYLEHHDEERKRLLLLHNNEDVKGMLALLPLFNLAMLIQPDDIAINDVGTEDTDMITFSGTLKHHLPTEFTMHEEGLHLKLGPDRVRGMIKLYNGTLRLYFPDTASYVYLVEEERIVPKIIASDIPKERKRVPKKDECFTESEGQFIRVPTCRDDSLYDAHRYKHSLKDKTTYIKLDKDEGISCEWFSYYLSDILSEKIWKKTEK